MGERLPGSGQPPSTAEERGTETPGEKLPEGSELTKIGYCEPASKTHPTC